jgi:hypothetical protein
MFKDSKVKIFFWYFTMSSSLMILIEYLAFKKFHDVDPNMTRNICRNSQIMQFKQSVIRLALWNFSSRDN